MRGPAKKANTREAFVAVFEEQTRRFSAFELLGLSADHPPLTQQSSQEAETLGNFSPSAKAASSLSKAEALRPDSEREVLGPDRQVEIQGPDSQAQENDQGSKAEGSVANFG